MSIGDLDVPVVGKNVIIAILVQSHIFIVSGVATFFFGFFTTLIVVGGSVLFTYWISKDE